MLLMILFESPVLSVAVGEDGSVWEGTAATGERRWRRTDSPERAEKVVRAHVSKSGTWAS